MARMFKVSVEYTNGDVKDYVVDAQTWFDIVYPFLESNDNIEHYGVDTIR